MEFEDVSAEVEREARRVAAAFGVEIFDTHKDSGWWTCQGSATTGIRVAWEIDPTTGMYWSIEVGEVIGYEGSGCKVFFDEEWIKDDGQETWPSPRLEDNELMAWGLFRLGLDRPTIITELNHPLSMHEKLELRLSMPCEFWPKKWLEEEL